MDNFNTTLVKEYEKNQHQIFISPPIAKPVIIIPAPVLEDFEAEAAQILSRCNVAGDAENYKPLFTEVSILLQRIAFKNWAEECRRVNR